MYSFWFGHVFSVKKAEKSFVFFDGARRCNMATSAWFLEGSLFDTVDASPSWDVSVNDSELMAACEAIRAIAAFSVGSLEVDAGGKVRFHV